MQLEGVITPTGAVRISPVADKLVLFWADKTVPKAAVKRCVGVVFFGGRLSGLVGQRARFFENLENLLLMS